MVNEDLCVLIVEVMKSLSKLSEHEYKSEVK